MGILRLSLAKLPPFGISLELPEATPDLSYLKATLGNLHITLDRLTVVKTVGNNPNNALAKLDQSSQKPRDVILKHLFIPNLYISRRYRQWRSLGIADALKVWEGLKHPNVLGLLGCSLDSAGDIRQLILPNLSHGNMREYLANNPVGVAQQLGFVRDVTAGLDYLHSQNPPICHRNLNPLKILIDEHLNAVLSGFEPLQLYADYSNSPREIDFISPERLLAERRTGDMPSDVWAWGCIVFQILTKKQPFNGSGTIIHSIVKRRAPGRAEMLLVLVPHAPKPEYASTLRLLASYLPLCWEYEPRKRPPISLLRQQVFLFSFEEEAGESVVKTLEELAHLLIPPDRLRLIERSELGAGNYGHVVLGTLDEGSPTARRVAVKRLKAVGTRGERVRLVKRLARELNIWSKITHPNVVDLIGYCLDERYESPQLVSALMPHGNILGYIQRFGPGIGQRVAFVKGITAGLACLHNSTPPICHADLKPDNVLIDLHMNAVLCDFGLASFVGGSENSPGLVTSTTIKGTARYMSRELLADNCQHSLESDVWAWACTAFQVITGSFPYPGALGVPQICMAMVKDQLPGDVNLLLPDNFEEADSNSAFALRFLHSTLPQCWDYKPKRRPSIGTVLSQISNPPSAMVLVASSGSREVKKVPEPSQNPLGGLMDNEEGVHNAGWVDVPAGTASENLLKRTRDESCSSANADDNDDNRQVRTRVERSPDGVMAAEVDEEREGCDTLKAQLLTLAAAMNGGLQTARGEATHESRTRIRGIRKALGQKWESQLATVLQDIDYLGENGGTTTSLINTEEVQASQHPTGSQLQAVRSTSPTVIEDPDVRMEE